MLTTCHDEDGATTVDTDSRAGISSPSEQMFSKDRDHIWGGLPPACGKSYDEDGTYLCQMASRMDIVLFHGHNFVERICLLSMNTTDEMTTSPQDKFWPALLFHSPEELLEEIKHKFNEEEDTDKLCALIMCLYRHKVETNQGNHCSYRVAYLLGRGKLGLSFLVFLPKDDGSRMEIDNVIVFLFDTNKNPSVTRDI